MWSRPTEANLVDEVRQHGNLPPCSDRPLPVGLGPDGRPMPRVSVSMAGLLDNAGAHATASLGGHSAWVIEGTFAEVCRHLGVETQHQWSDLAIRRTTPALLEGRLSPIADPAGDRRLRSAPRARQHGGPIGGSAGSVLGQSRRILPSTTAFAWWNGRSYFICRASSQFASTQRLLREMRRR